MLFHSYNLYYNNDKIQSMRRQERKNFLIIDAHALLHRAFHALPPLTNKKGEPVGATFGFFSILLSVFSKISPRFLAICFDLPVPTFRHREFVGYQAKRPSMDRGLSDQIKRTLIMLGDAGINVFSRAGFEADDLIATVAKEVAKKVKKVFILTGDKDLMQLVNQKVNLLLLQRGIGRFSPVGPKTVEKRLGVKPSCVVDLKALVGDSSDNYPGVPGIGPKTALQLLEKYGSFDNIYQHLDKIKGINQKRLSDGEEAGRLSFKLAKIIDDVPVKIDFRKTKWGKKDLLRLKEILAKEGFASLVRRMEKDFNLEVKAKEQIGLFS